MRECCVTGFRWNGTPKGREDKLAENNTYITGNDTTRAVLILHDALGWSLNNTRLLADHYAEEVGATVYLPDFFHGDPINQNNISFEVTDGKVEMKQNPDFDWAGWFAKNGTDARKPEINACAQALREQYTKVGVVGFCWGGMAGFEMASQKELVDCITVVHSGAPKEEQIRGIKVPFQMLAAEYDPLFSPELVETCNREIPKLGVDYMYQHFPGMKHGFATKADETKEDDKKGLEKAKSAVVYWLVTHL